MIHKFNFEKKNSLRFTIRASIVINVYNISCIYYLISSHYLYFKLEAYIISPVHLLYIYEIGSLNF